MYRTKERMGLESGHRCIQPIVESVVDVGNCPSPVKYKDREYVQTDSNDVAKNEGNAKAGVTPLRLIDLSLLELMTRRDGYRSTSRLHAMR
jgi:hypothetical protein